MLEEIKQKLEPLIANFSGKFDYFSTEAIMDWLPGVVLVLFIILLRKKIASFTGNRLKQLLTKFKLPEKTTDRFIEDINSPLRLFGWLLALFALNSYFNLSENYNLFSKVEHSVGVIIVFWIFHAAVGLIEIQFNFLKRLFSKDLVHLLVKALKILVIFLAIASVLEIWGIKVAPILAGLGLFGVAVALGAQDLFKNIIAGISVMAEKRFSKGERIVIEGVVDGVVENIGFRSTKIINLEKAPVFVPNTELSDGVVINYSRRTHRKINFNVGLLYSTTIEQLKQIIDKINEYIQNNDNIDQEEAFFVKVDSFAASSIDIQINCFTKTTEWVEWLQIKEDLILKIKDIVIEAGSDFAYPSTTMYFGEDEKKVFKNKK